MVHDIKRVYDRVSFALKATPLLNSCSHGTRMVHVAGGYVCAQPGADTSPYSNIYTTAPIGAGTKAAIYEATDAGSSKDADDLLAGVFDIPRSSPWKAPASGITWNEDPFKSVYWRLDFYSLRPTQNLLYAYRTTGQKQYALALIKIDDSFFASESTSPYAWADYHAVAFRAMVLTDTWWRLRQGHQLTEAESQRFLVEIQKTGAFLADPNHYQPENNHAFNEGAALLQLAVDFPTMPGAAQWKTTATTRLDFAVNSLVDQDGVLVENSPYYEFYALDKLWQIAAWAKAQHVTIATDFKARLDSMINYATYILEPDGSVPLLGASLETYIRDHGTFAEMANANPYFKYVLTGGAKGRVPPKTSVNFPNSGQTIFRSGWGKGKSFVNQSYATFNVGPYRTAHSNLDALAFTLYGNGKALLPGTGLYTYAPGVMRDYFHGTGSHDTLTVDGMDQQAGSAVAGTFSQEDGVTYQSGESSLYAGVVQRRTVMMLDPSHYLVTDRISSTTTHTYQQNWHLFSGAKVTKQGLTVTGAGSDASQSITITQIDQAGVTVGVTTGQMSPPSGICSVAYGQVIPCPAVTYTTRGTDAQFTTLLTIGNAAPNVTVTHAAGDELIVHDGSRTITLNLTSSSSSPEVAHGSDTTIPASAGNTPIGSLAPSAWKVIDGSAAQALPSVDAKQAPGFTLTSNGTSTEIATQMGSGYDGGANNLQLRIKVSAVEDLSHLDIELSNDNWHTYVYNDLRNVYTSYEDKEWLAISLARGSELTGNVGHWAAGGPGTFDWSKIDGVRFVVEGKTDVQRPVTVEVNRLAAVPAQQNGKVVVVFDDGYQSILSAASYMHSMGMAGNVAVIAKYAKLPTQDHLNVDQLLMLQNQWGWNMANHTLNHLDGVEVYADTGNLSGYADDVLAGAQFLEDAGLNSAPNWFIYPHGDTNDGLESVLSGLYRFARTTQDEPIAYPFGTPLAVTDLEVEAPTDAEGGAQGQYTSPAQVAQAVADTKQFGNTLILTFHRIHATASDPPGYDLKDFEAIMDNIKATGIPVLTLSQLDKSNGVPEDNQIKITPAAASQTLVRIHVDAARRSPSVWSRLTSWL